MNAIVLFVLALSAPVRLPDDGGVTFGPGRESFGSRAMLVCGNGAVEQLDPPDKVFAGYVGTQLPPSDRGKFTMTAYVDSTDPESRQLLRDLEEHPALKQLKEWCAFQSIDRHVSPAAEARHIAAQLKDYDTPTLLVNAHPDHPVFGKGGPGGWTYAFKRSGYGGDAGLLARNLYRSLRKHYEAHGVAQCPGPYCPRPNPYQPEPSPNSEPYQPWPNNPQPNMDPDWSVEPLPQMDDQLTGIWDSVRGIAGLTAGVLVLGVAVCAFGLVLWVLVKIVYPRLRRFVPPDVATVAPPAAAPVAPVQPAAQQPPPQQPPPQQPPAGPPAGPAAALLIALVLGASVMAAEPPTAGPPVQGPVEQAYIYPPCPADWEWLDRSVRDEVRRAIDPPRVEGFLMDSMQEINVASAGVAEAANQLAGVAVWIKATTAAALAILVLCAINTWLLVRGQGRG